MGKVYKIFTDGSCKKPNEEGGWAFVLLDEEENIIIEKGGFYKECTSQQMEIKAIEESLSYMKDNFEEEVICELYSDSKYGVKGCNSWLSKWKSKDWKKSTGTTIAHLDMWKNIDNFLNSHTYYIKHVRAHTGNVWNEHVDGIAKSQWQK